MFKKILRVFAEYFVFFVGLLFIFVLGLIYAAVKPQGIFFNAVFFAIAVGWILFMIKYFWELLEKNKKDT